MRAEGRGSILGGLLKLVWQLKPMVERIPPAEEHFEEQECGFWSRLSSRLHFLSLLSKREKGLGQRDDDM